MRGIRTHITGMTLSLLLAGEMMHAQTPQAHAQAPQVHVTAPQVQATVDRTKILIGEPIQLMLEATVHGDAPLIWPSLDSLPHFEFVEKGKVDSTIRPDSRYYRQYLTVTSFDSGFHAIPRLPFVAGNKRSFTDSVRVEIDYSKFDPKKDYHDIRDIIDIPNPYVKYIPWIVAAVTLIAIALVIWLVGKRKLLYAGGGAEGAGAGAKRLSPYEQAVKHLDELAAQKAWENAPVKTFYTRLNDILRLFIERRLDIASLAETNEELIRELRKLSLSEPNYAALAETLRMSDFVKFAKYVPGATDNEHHFRVIRAAVDDLEKIGAAWEAERVRDLELAAAANNN